MNTEKFIIHLITEELRNKRLIFTLEDLGFDCSSFTLNINKEILELVGFRERPDELYLWYFSLIENALEETTFWNLDEMLKKWSLILYNELIDRKLKEEMVEQ